jgi:hypothetical protein
MALVFKSDEIGRSPDLRKVRTKTNGDAGPAAAASWSAGNRSAGNHRARRAALALLRRVVPGDRAATGFSHRDT